MDQESVTNVETAAPQQVQEQVPLAALQSERAQRQQLQDELKTIKEHLSLLNSSKAEQPKDEFDSLADDDVLTVKEAKRALAKMQSQTQATLEELKIAQRYPDYQQVITEHLPSVLTTNPALRASLQKTQDYELAYHLAKNSDSYRNKAQPEKSVKAEKILENSLKTGSLSSIGATTPISQNRRYKDMNDSDFANMVAKNRGLI